MHTFANHRHSSKYRSTVGTLLLLMFPCGIMLLAPIAYVLRPWRHLLAFTTVPGVLALWLLAWVPESPRWCVCV